MPQLLFLLITAQITGLQHCIGCNFIGFTDLKEWITEISDFAEVSRQKLAMSLICLLT